MNPINALIQEPVRIEKKVEGIKVHENSSPENTSHESFETTLQESSDVKPKKATNQEQDTTPKKDSDILEEVILPQDLIDLAAIELAGLLEQKQLLPEQPNFSQEVEIESFGVVKDTSSEQFQPEPELEDTEINSQKQSENVKNTSLQNRSEDTITQAKTLQHEESTNVKTGELLDIFEKQKLLKKSEDIKNRSASSQTVAMEENDPEIKESQINVISFSTEQELNTFSSNSFTSDEKTALHQASETHKTNHDTPEKIDISLEQEDSEKEVVVEKIQVTQTLENSKSDLQTNEIKITPVHQVTKVLVPQAMEPNEVKTLKIALQPNELGEVLVTLKSNAKGELSASLKVTTQEGFNVLGRDFSQMKEILKESGFEAKHISLELSMQNHTHQQNAEYVDWEEREILLHRKAMSQVDTPVVTKSTKQYRPKYSSLLDIQV
jgi:hypothetical protein